MSDETRGPAPSTVELCVAAWQRAHLALGADPNLEDDENAINAALGADPRVISIDELLNRIVRALTFATLRYNEARELVGMMRAREQRYAARISALRTELLGVMEAVRRKKHISQWGTASVIAGRQSVLIMDESALPPEYVTVQTIRTPDRGALLADLREGVVIDGAALSNGAPTVMVRRPKGVADPDMEDSEPEDA